MDSLCLAIARCHVAEEIDQNEITAIELEISNINKAEKIRPETIQKINNLWQSAFSYLKLIDVPTVYQCKNVEQFEEKIKDIAILLMPYLQEEEISELFSEYIANSDTPSLVILSAHHPQIKIDLKTVLKCMEVLDINALSSILSDHPELIDEDYLISLIQGIKIDFLQILIDALIKDDFSCLKTKSFEKILCYFSPDRISQILQTSQNPNTLKFFQELVKIFLVFTCKAIRSFNFDQVNELVRKYYNNNYQNLLMKLIDFDKFTECKILLQNNFIDENTIDYAVLYALQNRKFELLHLLQEIKEFEKLSQAALEQIDCLA